MTWPQTAEAALVEQQRLAPLVRLEDDFAPLETVAGLDAGFVPQTDGSTIAHGAVVLLRLCDLQPLASATAELPVTMPYIPGFLSFREAPVLLAALAKLPALPDLLICDGQGFAHPRRFGLACHLGLLTDRPAIGCAKTRLIGTHAPLGPEKGATADLLDHGQIIGTVLRSRTNTKPLYLSPGHRVSFSTSVALVVRCLTRYRLPETTRLAHRLASHHLPPCKKAGLGNAQN